MYKKYRTSYASNDDIAEIADDKNTQFYVDSNEDSLDEEMDLSLITSASNSPIKYQSSLTQTLNHLNAIFDLIELWICKYNRRL